MACMAQRCRRVAAVAVVVVVVVVALFGVVAGAVVVMVVDVRDGRLLCLLQLTRKFARRGFALYIFACVSELEQHSTFTVEGNDGNVTGMWRREPEPGGGSALKLSGNGMNSAFRLVNVFSGRGILAECTR